MKKNYFLIVLSLIFVSGRAQDFNFGNVSIKELQEQSYVKDTTITAAVLYAKTKVYYTYSQGVGFELIKEVCKRIKLYSKEGFDHANHVENLYKNGYEEERLSSLKAVTYNLIDGRIEKTKMGKESIFKSEYSENYDQVKFTLPKLREGAVIEYKYKIRSPFLFNIGRVVLQDYIPIVKMEVDITAPEYFNFRKFTSGYLPINLKESVANGSVIINGNQYDNKLNKYKIYASSVAPFKREPYCGNTKNYISAITFELSYIKYPNGVTKNYASSWKDVIKRVFDSDSFGEELAKNNYFKEEVDQLLIGVTDPKERVTKIFDFVKQKIKWNEQLSMWSYKGVKKAYKEGVGNTADINLILAAMLKYAKLDTDMVLVGTTRQAVSLFPTLDGFDDVICRVRFDDNSTVYLDASDIWSTPNVLPDRVLYGNGRLVAASGVEQIVNFRTNNASKLQYIVQCDMDINGGIKGKAKCQQKEYLAYNFRKKYGFDSATRSLGSHIQKKFDLTSVEHYQCNGHQEFGEVITEKFSFEAQNQVEVIGDEIFFSPMLFLKNAENIFKSDERKYPVDFGYGYTHDYMVTIAIPEGYKVTEAPQSGILKLPDSMGQFIYQLSIKSSMLQLHVTEKISSPLILTEYYPALKEFYNKVIAKENEQVVLKKV